MEADSTRNSVFLPENLGVLGLLMIFFQCPFMLTKHIHESFHKCLKYAHCFMFQNKGPLGVKCWLWARNGFLSRASPPGPTAFQKLLVMMEIVLSRKSFASKEKRERYDEIPESTLEVVKQEKSCGCWRCRKEEMHEFPYMWAPVYFDKQKSLKIAAAESSITVSLLQNTGSEK